MKTRLCVVFLLLSFYSVSATYKVYYFPPGKDYKKKWTDNRATPQMQNAMLPALSDAGTVAMATGMPVSSIMSMLTSPLQSNILSTMARVVRNDMTSPMSNKVANPARVTSSMMSNTIMNPTVSSMANPMSINPMSSNPMMSLMSNPMGNQLMLSTNNRVSGRSSLLIGRNSGMINSMVPAANPDTAILVPSSDEILSSAMMEAIGQTAMPAYLSQLSRFFGSSYF